MERDGKRGVMRERERERERGGETNNTLLEVKYVTYRSIVHKLLHRVFLPTEMKHTRTQVTLFSYMYMYNHTTITLLRDLSLSLSFFSLEHYQCQTTSLSGVEVYTIQPSTQGHMHAVSV